MPDRIDHHHDHEAETDGHSDVPERLRLGVDHDRATAGEDERKRADELGDEAPRGDARRLTAVQLVGPGVCGKSSANSACTR